MREMEPLCRSRIVWASQREAMMLSTILIVILILALIGALPTWGYSRSWGYGPGGVLGTVLVVVLILALLGRV